MWLLFLALPIAIFMVVGGLLTGGAYTIVLLPLAAIIFAFSVWRVWASRTAVPVSTRVERARPEVEPLPHTHHANSAAPPTTPDQLVDAQRQAQ
jgi:hypothetical protein